MKKSNLVFSILSLLIILSSPVAFAEEPATKEIKIAFNLFSVDVKHNGKTVTIKRNQDKKNQIVDFYKKTSRGTIQKMYPFKPHTIETLGEREMIDYIKEMSDGDDSIIIIDSRTPDWVKLTGVIPGAVNIPFTEFKSSESTLDIMEDHFNVESGNVFNFKNAKTLVMYCNGNWCGQSPTAIKRLLKMGYPAAKIKYYRGGMNAWKSLGLKTVNL